MTKSTFEFVDQLGRTVDGLSRIRFVVDRIVTHRHAADLVAELFERQVDAALGLSAGGCQRPAELRQVADLDHIGGLNGGADREQHGGG